MKLTTGILFLGMVAGTAWGRNPAVIDNTRNTLKPVQQKHAADSNAALAGSQGRAANPATPASSQPASKPALKNVSAKHSSGKRSCGQEIGSQTAHRGRGPETAQGSEIGRSQANQSDQPARSFYQPGGQSQHAGFGMQHRQALPGH